MEIDTLKVEQETLLSIIKPEGKKILEIGCGTGRQALFLAKNADTYIGVDPNQDSIDTAKNNVTQELQSILRFEVGYGEKLNYQDNSYDTVIMILSFHEMPIKNQGIVLKEISRVLKKHGQLVIADPTEPAGSLQKAFDIAMEEFQLFNHPLGVIHSNWVIAKAMQQGLVMLNSVQEYAVDYTFENIGELIEYLTEDYKECILHEKLKYNILKDKVVEEFKIVNKKEKVKLLDEITVLDLVNNKI